MRPDAGEIRRHASISWPLGFAGSFAPDLTGAQNVRFVARIYGIDTDGLIAYVQDFAELGDFLDMPVRSYSSGMRARLAFGMSMGIAFDWYLVDEITAVGDSRFRKKSLAVFKDRLKDAGLLMTSHSAGTIRSYCTSGLVIEHGRAHYFDDVEDAIAVHERNMARPEAGVQPRAAAIRSSVAFSAALTFSPPKPRKPPSVPASATLAAIAFSQSRKPGAAAGAFDATSAATAASSATAASTTAAGALPRASALSTPRARSRPSAVS